MLRTLLLLFLLLPMTVGAGPLQLRVQGSNTMGAALLPALVLGQLWAQQATVVRQAPGAMPNETLISAVDAQGRQLRIDIAAHGTSTGFAALGQGLADMAAASRPISDDEAHQLQALGDLRAASAEQVIGLDAVAVIVHPDNPLPQLSTEQLAQIFAGRVRRWEELGVSGGDIHLKARDDRSGTYETFKALVLTAQGRRLAAQTQRFESNEAVAEQVVTDRQAIGFISLAAVHGAKVLAIADGNAPAMLPDRARVASEDYPLSRRLYLYLPANAKPQAYALAEFAQSAAGQAIVAQQGFVSQRVVTQTITPQAGMPPRYRSLARQAQRLSVNFRFQPGSASLDSKGLRDVQRVTEYLRRAGKLQGKAVLVGFGDRKETPGRAALLSRLRAQAVRRELARAGVEVLQVSGMGDELPVAGNDQQHGRLRNQRVEVWVY
ncbi:phosphate ABC transporter substrate-binding/OmpA family protein [Pseudomonas sp. SMSB3]|uniref:phosphate ABC transporter substrate-binding/OmpA family protein n=1 Tax=unclassified Pseudomonas TaxID=196821 RepID=UPI0028AB1EF4|nr:phosphate ABC transporter substrate-binding/OmpA family protein [Pseudomonas sp.]